jgi:predicted phosphodiesterase
LATRFLHISDIHLLGLDEGSPLDPNRRLREALELDVGTEVREHGEIDAILIGGDIAATGQTHEFTVAIAWIERLCGIVGATHNDVFSVPGNHDVDRDAARVNGLVRVAEEYLRRCPTPKIDRILRTILADDAAAGPFLSRLDNYHEFAARYDCGVTPEHHCWKRQLPADLGGRAVMLVGLNTALVSGDADPKSLPCEDHKKLVMGKGQAYLHAEDDAIVIALCHHPLPWLRDAGEVEEPLRRAQIQLFGHEHRPRVIGGVGEPVQIFAGAVQPPDGDGEATPSYNFICLDVADDELRVGVSARRWDGRRFVTDEEVASVEDIPIKLGAGTVTMPEPNVNLSTDERRDAMWQLMQRSPEERRGLLARLDVSDVEDPLTPLALGEAVRLLAERGLWEDLARELAG